MNTTTSTLAQRPQTATASVPPEALVVSETILRGVVDVFQMLADPSRFKILLALARCGEMHVSALCQALGQSQPAVSHHLALLRARRMVNVRRNGKNNFYCLDSKPLRGLLEQFFDEACDGQRHIEMDGFRVDFTCR